MGFFFRKRPREAPGGGNPPISAQQQGPPREYGLADFEVLVTLGCGTFGRVRLCRHLADDEYYALKMVKKSLVVKMGQTEQLKAETRLLRLVARHPFVVELRGTFQDELRVYLLMEYVAGGELYFFIRKQGKLPVEQALFFTAELTLALDHLHSLYVAHRALKPENLLIDREGHLKLGDFGSAKIVKDRTFTLCGTPEYCAPEVIASAGHGRAVDWWGLGVLLYESLTGRSPFRAETPMAVYDRISTAQYQTPDVDLRARDLIRRLLQVDRTRRLGCGTSSSVKQHAFYSRVDWDAIYHKQCVPPHPPPELDSRSDTKNFDQYPDSEPGVEEPLQGKDHDLFRDFFG